MSLGTLAIVRGCCRQKDRKTVAQKPMIPILPVQSWRPSSQCRTTSTASNAAPLRADRSTIKARMQRRRPPQQNRSSAHLSCS
jgi:hypothetical protein